MRSILSWLLIIGVFAAVGLRAFASGPDHNLTCATECHPSDHDHGEEPCGDSHDRNDECPPGPHHHHHGMCAHVSPMAIDSVASLRVRVPDGQLLGLLAACFFAPDSPYFELDKPPLI